MVAEILHQPNHIGTHYLTLHAVLYEAIHGAVPKVTEPVTPPQEKQIPGVKCLALGEVADHVQMRHSARLKFNTVNRCTFGISP
jgi:hypothetical protein